MKHMPRRPVKHTETIQKTELPGPAAFVSRRAADRLRSGHVWVYQSDVQEIKGGPGNLVAVADSRGILLGTALYSPASQIALRLVSLEMIEEHQWLELLQERLKAAIALRKPLLNAETNASRLIFSEADALPGIIADKYGELIILQLLTKPLDNTATRSTIARVLIEELSPATIVERPDPRIRELEQMSAPPAAPLFAKDSEHPLTQTSFRLNGLTFHYDANAGQKTGAFLDQRENYAAAARYARGEALDVCTYQGGFALHLNRVCSQVTAVDISRAALEIADQNEQLNASEFSGRQIEWIEGNAFDLLRDYSDAGRQYDTVVLDPPAFTKSKRAVEGALSGYKEINLRAFKMLRPGGILVTCSCSHHVSRTEFLEMLTSAAMDARRQVRVVEERGQSVDHPVLLGVPETSYLKCVILQ